MKILSVRFKNLNSLVGEWQIDFTHPEYVSNGIFAITGPTGAGKTTIMDALCLGLYGTTPRLDKVTKSSNEIMSRRTGECFAEVTFETQKGRYRCHWRQHRSRRQPDGELQQARHEIVAADSNRVLESKLNQVGEFIEEVTGMDFERFTRSMLLAQGGFATFLLAPPGKRGDILEQVTGTEIYSRISMQVHERLTTEKGKLALLQAAGQGGQILSAEEEGKLQTVLAEKQAGEETAAGKREHLRQASDWFEKLRLLEKELEELDKEWQDCEKRRQAFEPALRKLARARRVLALEGDYRSAAVLRGQQADETKELEDAIAKLPEKEQAGAAVLARKGAAENRLRELQERQLAAGGIMKRVRELDTRRSEISKQVAEQEKAIEEAACRGKEYGEHLEKAARTGKELQAALQAIDAYQAANAAEELLNANLTAIGRMFAALCDRESELIEAGGVLSAAMGKREAAAFALEKLAACHEAAHREFVERQRERESLSEELRALLQGREIGQWRDEQEARKDRERLLLQAGEALARIDGTRRALADVKAALAALNAQEAQLAAGIKARGDEKILLERETENLEAQVSLLARIRDLEEERKRLADGRPCPLCGAVDHPYAQGNVPAGNEAEAKLTAVRDLCRKAAQELGTLEAARVRTMAEISHGEKERQEKEGALKKDEELYGLLLTKLPIQFDEQDRAVQVHAELARIRTELAEMSPLIGTAEAKIKREKSLQSALTESKDKLEKAELALREARHGLAAARLEQERLSREFGALKSQTEALRAAALKDVEAFGVDQLPAGSLDNILKDLTDRRDKWQARGEEKTSLKRRIAELNAEIEKEEALLSNLEREVAARRRDRDELAGQRETWSAERRELFGEKSPDAEEKLLRDTAAQVGAELEIVRAECAQRDQEAAALKEKIASLRERTATRAEEMTAAEGLLMERLGRAGFTDEADFLSAWLAEEEREGLTEKELSLTRERTDLSARRRDKEEARQKEWARQITDRPYEALQKELVAAEADWKQLHEEIGALKNRLQENEKLREKQRERLGQVEAQKKECARWYGLHQLIGSADGKKFRNFAQGLTFEMLTAQANRQLKKMTDRYLLVRDGSQPLELNVIDNYQAGEIRSTKNLSGGESFIVSLALALGLSHMASRNVRVDSLFLDEGFGTLDEDALETALETLAGLRQDGKLIGVISHVAALKERIGTQIQVTPERGGHSSISGPGCRRCGLTKDREEIKN